MSDPISVLPEPPLEFRHQQLVSSPHDGLRLFGPVDTDLPQRPKRISHAVIGTPAGLQQFAAFSAVLANAIAPENNERLWPVYPGFEAAFGCAWSTTATRTMQLDATALDEASRQLDPNKRAAAVVDAYLNEIRRVHESDDPVDVVVCVVPDTLYERCRPLSRIPKSSGLGERTSPHERRQRAKGQLSLIETFDPKVYRLSVDFRRQLKARVMELGIPVQIVRESTLRLTEKPTRGGRGLTPLSDRAWNLAVAFYYKAGGKPWRLATARDGVCYIGLAFRQTSEKKSTAACAAQMFLDSGDGIVFLGRAGAWFSPNGKALTLSRDAAHQLLEGTLRTYHDQNGLPLTEIFLHSRSWLNPEAIAGFHEACPAGVKLVCIRVRKERRDVRLLREGNYPVLRGTFWQLGPREGYLWASGFKPRLGTYDGHEMPIPLRIDIQDGDAVISQVAADILGLTKLNYNACRLGESQPVTIGFSDQVGEILVSNPGVKNPRPQFRFYT